MFVAIIARTNSKDSGMKRTRSAKPKVRINSVKRLVQSGICTPGQSRFLLAFMATRNKALAARHAGYKGDYAQAGYQAFKAIAAKAPEVILNMGITIESVIENHLLPKLSARQTKLAQHNGRFTDRIEVDDHRIQLYALRTMLELMNAFPPKEHEQSAETGPKVIVVDVPRPDFSMVNVTPRSCPRPAASSPGKIYGPKDQSEDSRPKD